MTEPDSTEGLTLITWNIERSSISRLEDQLTALHERSPDIVALQEVGVKASRRPRQILRENGFEYSAHSHEFHLEDFGNSSGIAFASRWPLRVMDPETFDMPAQHQALSAEFYTPFGRVEGHAVHVLPGSQYGEMKVEMFEGIYERLAQDNPPDYRFLCGDFNSPKEESDDGEVTVWGSEERWIEAERSVMVALAKYDLTDAYREVSGYGDGEYSWVAKNQGGEWPRRFDHVFASERLNATEATYLHQYDDLSDHTPLEVVFDPIGKTESDAGSTEGTQRMLSDSESTDDTDETVVDGLTYAEDVRTVAPEANYRRGRFKAGWNEAVSGGEMGDDTLERLTWENLGWRLGKLLGETSEAHMEELYEWCVEQQTE